MFAMKRVEIRVMRVALPRRVRREMHKVPVRLRPVVGGDVLRGRFPVRGYYSDLSLFSHARGSGFHHEQREVSRANVTRDATITEQVNTCEQISRVHQL